MAMRVARKGVVILAAFLSIWFGKTWVSSLRNQQLTASQLEAILISLPSLPDDEQIKTMARIGELPLETWQKLSKESPFERGLWPLLRKLEHKDHLAEIFQERIRSSVLEMCAMRGGFMTSTWKLDGAAMLDADQSTKPNTLMFCDAAIEKDEMHWVLKPTAGTFGNVAMVTLNKTWTVQLPKTPRNEHGELGGQEEEPDYITLGSLRTCIKNLQEGVEKVGQAPTVILQSLIHNPVMVRGRKLELRVLVLVARVAPLLVLMDPEFVVKLGEGGNFIVNSHKGVMESPPISQIKRELCEERAPSEAAEQIRECMQTIMAGVAGLASTPPHIGIAITH